jgi:hypothetical protein
VQQKPFYDTLRQEDAVFLARGGICDQKKKTCFPTLHFSAAYLAPDVMHVRVTLCEARVVKALWLL